MNSPLRGPGVVRLLVVLLCFVALLPRGATAQIISPGKLAQDHAALEGIRNCTQCHQLRQRGIDNAKCLECHAPLKRRIAERKGLHARSSERNCADCHRDHFGQEFALVTFDTAKFDHTDAGFELEGAHHDLGCRDCHEPGLVHAPDVRAFASRHGGLDRTFLGLGTTCRTCHESDDPHDDQFGDRACTACHTQQDWTPASGFDHDRAKYRLTGAHRKVDCAGCHRDQGRDPRHPRVRYTGLASGACSDCHTDPHGGAMRGACATCHATTGWRQLDRSGFEGRFDHSRTGFILRGAHAGADCRACHTPARAPRPGVRIRFVAGGRSSTYPKPVARDCLSCHVDRHQGAFKDVEGGAVCTNCHGERSWLPSSFDLERHNRPGGYALTGAHRAVACQDCHVRSADSTAWTWHITGQACEDCHGAREPHAGQFAGQACADCHTTATFAIAGFDHSKTRYPLDGAHVKLPCADCHRQETTADGKTFRRYTPLGTACRDCHGGT